MSSGSGAPTVASVSATCRAGDSTGIVLDSRNVNITDEKGNWAVAGRPQHWLLAVAGHVSPEMTRRYLDLAAIVRGKFGTPHPKLPASLLARGKAGLFRVA